MKFNLTNIILLIAFIALPVAGLMLHLKLHPDLTFLTYILWFDIIAITLMYLFNKSIFYGFALNSVFFIVGVIMHIMYVPGGGITDILLAIPDFSIGYVLWIQNKTKTQSTKHKKEEPKESKNKEEEEPKKEETEPTIKK